MSLEFLRISLIKSCLYFECGWCQEAISVLKDSERIVGYHLGMLLD
jgi:hypothetical protein